MNNHIVPNSQLIPIIEHDGETAVNLRDLHAFLEVKKKFTDWAQQMFEYGFTQGTDFIEISLPNFGKQVHGGHNRKDWAVTIDTAKEISMIQRTDKGKEARQYFIEVEKRGTNLSDDEILHRALTISAGRVKALEAKVEEDAPKVDYHDTIIADEDLLSFRTVASDLKIGEQQLRELLLDANWIYFEITSRWSQSKQKKVQIRRYSAYADKKNYFQAVLHHDVPRFRGEVMHTLKITPAGASAIARLVERRQAA